MRNPEPFYALGHLPAGTDAAKGFFLCGIPEGRALTISTACYWGGDTGENYQCVITPPSQQVNDVAIDGEVGMLVLFEIAKGGGNTASLQALWSAQNAGANRIVPGPCSLVIASTNASNAAEFVAGIYGIMHDLEG